MLYGNIESQVVVHSFTEVVEGETKFTEKTARLVEFGLVHTLDTVYQALQLWELIMLFSDTTAGLT